MFEGIYLSPKLFLPLTTFILPYTLSCAWMGLTLNWLGCVFFCVFYNSFSDYRYSSGAKSKERNVPRNLTKSYLCYVWMCLSISKALSPLNNLYPSIYSMLAWMGLALNWLGCVFLCVFIIVFHIIDTACKAEQAPWSFCAACKTQRKKCTEKGVLDQCHLNF